MKVFAIVGTNLRRLFRERSNAFFVIIFPMLLILLLGSTFGGGFTPVVGVVDREIGRLGRDIVADLEATDELDVNRYSGTADLVEAVERGRVQAGLVIPTGYDAAIRNGDDVFLRLFMRPDSLAQRHSVEAAVGKQNNTVRSARFARNETGASLDQALAAAARVAGSVPGVEVRTTIAGEASAYDDLGDSTLAPALSCCFSYS